MTSTLRRSGSNGTGITIRTRAAGRSSERPGWLRIVSSPAAGLMSARNTLTQKITGQGCTATVKLDTAGMRAGDIAGVCILGFPSAFIGAETTGEETRLVMVNQDQRIATGPSLKEDIIHLRAEVTCEGLGRFYFSADDANYERLGDELVMQFSVKSFLGNKFGLFCYNMDAGVDGGWVDFDFFRYECARGAANHLDAFSELSFADYDAEHGVDTHRRAEKLPHQFLVNLHDGDWVRFDHIDFGEGADMFQLLGAPVGHGGELEIRLGSHEGEVFGTCLLPGNGEKNQWICPWLTLSCKMKLLRGPQAVCMRLRGAEGHLARLDTFRFSREQ